MIRQPGAAQCLSPTRYFISTLLATSRCGCCACCARYATHRDFWVPWQLGNSKSYSAEPWAHGRRLRCLSSVFSSAGVPRPWRIAPLPPPIRALLTPTRATPARPGAERHGLAPSVEVRLPLPGRAAHPVPRRDGGGWRRYLAEARENAPITLGSERLALILTCPPQRSALAACLTTESLRRNRGDSVCMARICVYAYRRIGA